MSLKRSNDHFKDSVHIKALFRLYKDFNLIYYTLAFGFVRSVSLGQNLDGSPIKESNYNVLIKIEHISLWLLFL